MRVPVFFGHAMAVHLEMKKAFELEQIHELLNAQSGVKSYAQNDVWPTPSKDSAGNDPVYVGRIRKDLSHPQGLNLWVVADNIRKGAALNAIQIAEKLESNWRQQAIKAA